MLLKRVDGVEKGLGIEVLERTRSFVALSLFRWVGRVEWFFRSFSLRSGARRVDVAERRGNFGVF